jgi:hypothetical protein
LAANKPIEKVSFSKNASSAGSKIGDYFLPLKVLGSGDRAWSQPLKKLC